MGDISSEQIQSINIQDFDGSEFDPYKMDNLQTGTNGSMQRNLSEGEILGYQHEYGDDIITGQLEYLGHDDNDEESTQNLIDIGGTVNKGYQDDYEQDEQPLVDFNSHMNTLPPGGKHMNLMRDNNGEYSSQDRSQNFYDDGTFENNDQDGDNYDDATGVQDVDSDNYDNEQVQGHNSEEPYYDNDKNSWHPEMDGERSVRSRSPDRFVSPGREGDSHGDVDSDIVSNNSDMAPSQADQQTSGIPSSDHHRSERSPHTLHEVQSSETESTDAMSEASSSVKKSRMRLPKPKVKKPLELPPWNDNVVIPPLPRMKPTLIGKQADLPTEPSSPLQIQRPRTASARHTVKDTSSDSGVEEEKNSKSLKKSSADVKRKYGTDSKNEKYKPGGGNVQVFTQKIDTKGVAPRTDTSTPKAALSPRSSHFTETTLTPIPIAPNTKEVHSKIGSLNNVKHTPGGGNVKVLSAKVDFTNVQSKVGSKDKIHHKPQGGDKKIESRKLTWQTTSKVGSLKNVTYSPGGGNVQILDQKLEVKAEAKVGSTANIKHKPGGGDKKIETLKLEFKETAKPKVASLEKVKHKPGGGDIKILDEKVDFTQMAKPKVGSLDKVKHQPGGGDVKIETQKLTFKQTAKSRTDTGASTGEKLRSRDHSCSESITSSQDGSTQGQNISSLD